MKWNKELDKKIIDLVSWNKTNLEIAIELNTSADAIRNRCRRLGVLRIRHEDVSCKNCGVIFNKIKSLKQKFCSSSCSASFTNIGKKQSEETKKKRKLTFSKKPKVTKPIKIRICKNCDNILRFKESICAACKLNYYKFYRPLCEFRFDLNNYPNRFDFNLIKKYGWYSPSNKKNNLSGVSRDHLYSVKDGFINKVDPEIISHPANCKLMKHSDNNRKNRNSSITLEELLERIKNWGNE